MAQLAGAKILMTGPTGQVALPVARAHFYIVHQLRFINMSVRITSY